MDNYVITISREFGSMGRTIAEKLAKRLEIQYYDRDIVEKVSREMNLSIPRVSDEEERASSYFMRSFPLGKYTSELQDQIFSVQEKIISTLAERESCIIVGRCADYVLQDFPRILRIHIYTSYENKYNNCVNILKIDPKDARKLLKTVDRAREAYHLRYAKYLPSDPAHNDVSMDSFALGVDGTVDVLELMAKKKFHIS